MMLLGVDHGLWLIPVAGLGAAIGSWMNVVILRLNTKHTWWQGHSACPYCGTRLQWFDMIPVLSFLWLRGKCRYCHKTLTRQYVIVEFLTMLGFVLVWQNFSAWPMVLVGWLDVVTMILIGVYDARWALIPDSFSWPFIIGAIMTGLVTHVPLGSMMLGGLAGGLFFAIQHVVSQRRWVGSGDIFLGVGLGFMLGWRFLLLSLFLAYFIGSLVASGLILRKRLTMGSAMPFGPYLMGAGIITLLYGQAIIDWYFNHAIFS